MTLNSGQIKELLEEIADQFEYHKKELSQYDAVIGDGDHGFSMARGHMAGKKRIQELDSSCVGDYFKYYGRSLTSEIGGAMGPLFGILFTEIGGVTRDLAQIGLREFTEGLSNAQRQIMELGGAKVGDKTMVDSIVPTVEALEGAVERGLNLKAGFEEAEAAARLGLESTIALRAKKGRSRYAQEKSIGHQDAGATSFYYFIKTIKSFIEREC